MSTEVFSQIILKGSFSMKKHGLITLITLSLLAAAPTYAANTEYNAIDINVLDAINAQAAYNQGYTGAGVNVGVCDFPTNFAHPDLIC